MKAEVPILIEQHGTRNDTLYRVHPLFLAKPCVQDRRLGKATSKLGTKLQKHLAQLAKDEAYGLLAQYTFCPDVDLCRVKLDMDLRKKIVRIQLPIVSFHHLARRLAWSPYLPELWFEVTGGESLAGRAEETYGWHLRKIEKDGEPDALLEEIARLQSASKLSISYVRSLVPNPPSEKRSKQDGRMSLFGNQQRMDGAIELEKVGRCLDQLEPDELLRAIHGETEIAELCKLLSDPDMRPVMLVGPRMAGKTAILHECVRRRIALRQKQDENLNRQRVWLLAPQRLISGMSYVGQWENRLLAILKRVRKKEHVLYFDDLIGMYQAGVHAHSDLSAADVMKPFVERCEIRIVAEMTSEQWRVFQEKDRGFADMFHRVKLEESDETETLRILIHSMRSLEGRFEVRFDVEVVPTIMELTRRFQREAAFPGKAARWLHELAIKHRGQSISRAAALREFQLRSGLQSAFLDQRLKLVRGDIVESLSRQVIGQEEAVEAMADVVSIAKARLNDSERPLGALLFLGPTGVGKTYCAKSLAKHLYGDPSRLLRFDMNEFITSHAAARLAGTFDQPEGLLTSAIRRSPYSIVLLDEIEKAHPDVHDLMLQILGEARLTDALGRTVDFSNTIIIVTSNLGTSAASQPMGFTPEEGIRSDSVYLKAVRTFFRPEFVNRFDRIVPFNRLSRDGLQSIAQALLADILEREGLSRRKCIIDIGEDALQSIVDLGYDPNLGARAMRRSLERRIVRPIARRMSTILPETPTILTIFHRSQDVDVRIVPLEEAQPLPDCARPVSFPDPAGTLEKARAALDRLQTQCQPHRTAGGIDPTKMTSNQQWYYGFRELLTTLRHEVRSISEILKQPPRPAIGSMQTPLIRKAKHRLGYHERGHSSILKEVCAADDVMEYLNELMSPAAVSTDSTDLESNLHGLLDSIALAQACAPTDRGWPLERALVLVRTVGAPENQNAPDTDSRNRAEEKSAVDRFGYPIGPIGKKRRPGQKASVAGDDYSPIESNRLIEDEGLSSLLESIHEQFQHQLSIWLFEGFRTHELLALQQGTHLVASKDGRLHPEQVVVIRLHPGDDASDVLLRVLARHQECRDAIAGAESTVIEDPFQWRPVLTIRKEGEQGGVDFRTGQSEKNSWNAHLLPLPPEWKE